MYTYNKIEEECQSIIQQFPGIKIRIAKRYGKRVSNLFSCGIETFAPVEKIELDNNYVMFLQNFTGNISQKHIIKKNINKITMKS